MSNRSSTSPRPQSPSNSLPPTQPSPSAERSPTATPPMIQIARPTLAPSSSLGALPTEYTSYPSRYIPNSPPYPSQTLSPSPTAHQSTPPPSVMRTFERGRGVKRARDDDKSGDEDERQASLSGSETDGSPEQPVLPAPKKRTRTLMTPDQLTALHRLLAMTRFPTTEQREQCGREIGLSARRVQVWFQNQRQKSKAQQQAAAQAGSSRGHALAPRSSGPYQVFSYDSLRYEPPAPPYTSPYPYAYDEPHHVPPAVPLPRRSSRLGYHRRGTSSLSYPPPPGSVSHDQLSRGYPSPHYSVEGEYVHSPVTRYEHRSPEPGGSHSPEASRRPIRDDTLPPIWPENDLEIRRRPASDVLTPVASSRPGSSRPTLLPTGLPPPQPLEPTPLWSHPHTNPRYMRPLPPASSLPSLLGSLNRGRARSDPPIRSLSSSSQGLPSLGLGLSLTSIRPSENPEEAGEDVSSSQERTTSVRQTRHRTPSQSESTPLFHELTYSRVESPRPQTARGGSPRSRRSSRGSLGHRAD
ncbi:hypothetical protein FRC08_003934 [Ceratobasidium sp. 394]|nr:hypothetical protein FRC08_003934 [Ceratobasidium sp. 394]KAG9098126.1 hypothetical protein FS749_004622 [Ceratobasidium sp. UAMH 11750]